MVDFIGEKLEKDLVTKQVFHFHDETLKVKCLSRETSKIKDETVYFPFDKRTGKSRYGNLARVRVVGFKSSIPVGLNKSPNKGYGFSRVLSRFGSYLDTELKIEELTVEKHGLIKFDKSKGKLTLSAEALNRIYRSLDSIDKRQRAEVKLLISQNLHGLFKKQIPKPKAVYIAGTVASSLAGWDNSIAEFSIADKDAIKSLFDKLSLTTDFLTVEALSKTKELVDNKYIQAALVEFKALMALKTTGDKLEKKWQAFLKANSWIFSSIFAQPVILHKDEAFVGGKNIDNKDGKLSDFLLKNKLSDNVSFLEIKTHKTLLLDTKAYRGTDVFSTTKELSGCIAQVLNQRDGFQKEFYALRYKSSAELETLNSKCVVLIGSIKDLTKPQRSAFELIRNNSRDVEILTFDELQQKIEALQTLIKKGV